MSIEAKELRLNNYVKSNYHNGSITQIRCLEPSIIRLWCNPFVGYKYDDIEPIPLTEEILLKAGFEKDKWHMPAFKHSGWCYYITEQLNGNWLVWDNGYDEQHLVIVNSLHSLQNLFFALTNTELKIEI